MQMQFESHGQSRGLRGVLTKMASGLTGLAVVYVRLALLAGVAGATVALVAAHRVVARGAVATWTLHTLVDVYLTGLACRGGRGGGNEFQAEG